jgi:hypothetical protein
MKRLVFLSVIAASALSPRPALAQLQEMRQNILGMD